MAKKDLTIQERKEAILTSIAKKISHKVAPPYKIAAETFAKLFYGNVSLEDLSETSLDALVNSTYEMWQFSLDRKSVQPKIKYFVEKREINGTFVSQTIIELINDNKPFLVDSVAGAINSLGYSIHLIVHPVMQVERDASHHLKKVFNRTQETKKGSYESFIRCEILGPSSPEKLKILKQEIERSLEDVEASVEDWLPMRKHLEDAIANLKKNPPPISKEALKESIYFLEWIEDNHFTFLGYCEYSISKEKGQHHRIFASEKGLGILKSSPKQELSHIFEGVQLNITVWNAITDPDPLVLTKTTQISLVHRRDPMDSLTIKRFDKEGKVIGFYQFVGLFTSVAYNQSAREIPLLRRKISRTLKRSGFAEQWHDGKTLLHILESFPRDELFQASEDWLFETSMAILQLQNRQRLTLFIRPDKFGRFVTCLVYVPRDRYDSELRKKIGDILEKDLSGKITHWQTQLGELAFARIHFSIRILQKQPLSYDVKAIENDLSEATLTWRDSLQKTLFKVKGEEKGLQLFEKYGMSFSKGYQEKFTAQEAGLDINEIESAFSTSGLKASLGYADGEDRNKLKFKIYSVEGPVSLSNVLPVLENMNMRVLSELPFLVTLPSNKKAWIHDFELETREGDEVDLEHIRENFLTGFNRVWQNEVENDGFNRLIVRANFSWRECQLIRAYAKYLRQLQVTFSQAYMEEVLANYPLICRMLIQLYTFQFCPDCKEDRDSARSEILKRILSHLEDVMNLDEDRILRKFVNMVMSTLRTNYYQLENDLPKSYLSFKIDCKEIDEMPLPRPLYEIFVYSPHVEAIHLRGGKVARGGIRWSDRKEDFRTEVLGLMKAQTVKNAVIVPVGSKGGFVLKQLPAPEDKEALKQEVISCYKTMICGLLDLTDNIVDKDIVSPPNLIKRDDDDPYLVVAADKGTSSFSDFANQLAADYHFWLGDAFASGGSSGYDHKKMGITSKGAWESVKRHFREMGMDATREKITVVGIGDMSGDVFGNGMLLSHHLKLQAAFSHLHIFIDPEPDPEKSYQERKRLFNLPHSSWADYNSALISKGGGVFDRKAKSISLTPEIKNLLEIHENHLTPSELITYILKASVDLIWFGGIGTFIKAKGESNIEVGDRTNDAVRINGIDVRAKVIAEGANLAVTQLGRVEYAKNGGRINTDAIDNSAGVDCSDHEVNIKILLSQAMMNNGLKLDKRNTLLEEMTDDVSRLVLKDNFWQNQILSLAQSHGLALLDEQARFMRDLETEGVLNRALEALPDETEIARRAADRQGLTRPELAVLLAYSKLALKHQLMQSEIPDLPLLHARLLGYFPERLQYAYREEIIIHPLRREITSTLFTNSIVNRMGITFISEMKHQTGKEGADVARAYLVVRDILDLVSLWRDIETLENLPVTTQNELMLSIYQNVKRYTDWFLRFMKEHHSVEDTINLFKENIDTLKEELSALFTPQQLQAYSDKCDEYEHIGLSTSLSERLVILEPLISGPDMVILSKDTKQEIQLVARVYFALSQQLGFDWLRKTARSLSGDTHWQQGAANALIEDLYATQKILAYKILMSQKSPDELFMEDGTLVKEIIYSSNIESTLFDLMNASTVDFAMMTVINQRLRILAQAS